MLLIEDLKVKLGRREILKNINLEIRPGETHILFGPNGSGKTSLLMTIMGYPQYKVVSGKVTFKGEDITHMNINGRAELGIGMSYQRPPSIQGLKTRQLIDICSNNGGDTEALAEELNFSEFLGRDINVGFSGGEIKKSELLQLMAQDPDLYLFDEPESGVDLENISLIGNTINHLLRKNLHSTADKSKKEVVMERPKMGLIITHTGFILDYVTADRGQVLYNGVLACKSNPSAIFRQIKDEGYGECVRCAI